MAEIEIQDFKTLINGLIVDEHISTTCTDFVIACYNLFYNTNQIDVTFTLDSTEYTIPNTAKNSASSIKPFNGAVDPEGQVYGYKGQFYYNTDNQKVFFQSSETYAMTGWKELFQYVATPTEDDVLDNINNLLISSESVVTTYYDMFYNTTPKDVTIKIYDSTSSTLSTITVPNRAKSMLNGLSGAGSPEGSVTATLGRVYVDTVNSAVYVKTTSTGNTGWAQFLNSSSLSAHNSSADAHEGFLARINGSSTQAFDVANPVASTHAVNLNYTGALSNLNTSNKTNFVNAINELKGNYKDLESKYNVVKAEPWSVISGNVNASGDADLIYSPTDTGTMYQDVTSQAFTDNTNVGSWGGLNSTSVYNPSVFTVVGSPTITGEGIASGFSASKYIKLPLFSTNGNDFKFIGSYTTPATLPSDNFMIIGGDNSYTFGAFQMYCNVTGNYINTTCFVNNSGASRSILLNIPVTWEVSTSYDFYFEKSGNTFTFGIKKESSSSYTTKSDTSSYPLYDTSQELLGRSNDFVGSIDLKKFSMTIDGEEVFNGAFSPNSAYQSWGNEGGVFGWPLGEGFHGWSKINTVTKSATSDNRGQLGTPITHTFSGVGAGTYMFAISSNGYDNFTLKATYDGTEHTITLPTLSSTSWAYTSTFTATSSLTQISAQATTASGDWGIGSIHLIQVIPYSTYSGSLPYIFFKAGPNYSSVDSATIDGYKLSLPALNTINLSSTSNGTYKVFINATTGVPYLKSCIICRTKTEPSSPSVGTIWKNVSVFPVTVKEYNSNTNWVDFKDIPLGEVTVASNKLTSATTYDYCNRKVDTPTAVSPAYLISTYSTGASWGRIWSNGFVEQGGQATLNTSAQTITLPVSYKNTYYNIVYACTSGSATYGSKATGSFTLTGSGTITCIWRTTGFANI